MDKILKKLLKDYYLSDQENSFMFSIGDKKIYPKYEDIKIQKDNIIIRDIDKSYACTYKEFLCDNFYFLCYIREHSIPDMYEEPCFRSFLFD